MNVQRAERAVQIISLPLVWLAFVVVWGSADRHLHFWSSKGADLPDPTLLWLMFAGSWISLLVPAICTAVMAWALRNHSGHANWLAGAILVVASLYATAAHLAAILPAFTMCGAV